MHTQQEYYTSGSWTGSRIRTSTIYHPANPSGDHPVHTTLVFTVPGRSRAGDCQFSAENSDPCNKRMIPGNSEIHLKSISARTAKMRRY
jgi:hypothetical protein